MVVAGPTVLNSSAPEELPSAPWIRHIGQSPAGSLEPSSAPHSGQVGIWLRLDSSSLRTASYFTASTQPPVTSRPRFLIPTRYTGSAPGTQPVKPKGDHHEKRFAHRLSRKRERPYEKEQKNSTGAV